MPGLAEAAGARASADADVAPAPASRLDAREIGTSPPGADIPAAPIRSGGAAVALVTGSEAFPVMEKLVFEARSRIVIAMRIFDPATILRLKACREAGLATWCDLIAATLGEGVRVRLLLTDFDPLNAAELHATAWRDARPWFAPDALADRDGFECLLMLHEGALGPAWAALLWPFVRRKAVRLAERDETGELPGLEPLRTARGGVRWWPPAPVWPATHHQKVIVADGKRAVIGGLDINERRFDTLDHERRGDQTWHDVSVWIEGKSAADAEAHLDWLWSREIGRQRSTRWPDRDLPRPTGAALSERCDSARPDDRDDLDSVIVERAPVRCAATRLLRTLSVGTANPLAVAPAPHVREIETGVVETIRSATGLVYIENQFVRAGAIAKLLADRLRACPALEVIILVPMAPDTVAFDGKKPIDARYGEWLQARAIRQILAAGGGRAGVFSLAGAMQPGPDAGRRATAFGTGIVYMHAKVLIVDDRVAMVSSANLNLRSLWMDTEAGVLIEDAGFALTLRERLWSAHLGEQGAARPRLRVADWRRIANRNAADPDRSGAISLVPYVMAPVERFARWVPFIPRRYL